MDLLDLARVVRPVEQVEATAGRSADICGASIQVLLKRCAVGQYLEESAQANAGRRGAQSPVAQPLN